LQGVEKLIAAGARPPGQGVLEQALEGGGSVKFFFGRTGQLLVQVLPPAAPVQGS